MSLSDAIEAATRIVDCYPNGGINAGKSYIGALAATLVSYPRQVALGCADRVRGVTRGCRFLPTVSDIVAWCERNVEPLYRQAEREQRIAAQIANREQSVPTDASMARVEAMRADCLKRLNPRLSDEAIEARAVKAAAIRERRLREVAAEWDGDDPPRLAGYPVSRELVASMTTLE